MRNLALHGSVLYLASFASLAVGSRSGIFVQLQESNGEQCQYPSLIDATSNQLQEGLERGCFSSVDLVNAYVERVNEVNPTLHAVTELNPDALEIAKELDLERSSGSVRGPLHGLPVLIKGNIGTADQLNTTAGSYALLGAELPYDSTVVAKLRDAGIIVLGMANLAEWANFRSSNSTGGWSAYGGQVTAAYYPQQEPGSSSSGSGVSADLGLAFAALGTETSGSIVAPSGNNNIVGIKPTVGLTSRHLVIPISEHQDTIGPMARTVLDAAKLLQSIAGPDPNDNYTSAIPFGSELPDYVSACTKSALKGKRIGIPRNVLGANLNTAEPIGQTFNTAISQLSDLGATIVDGTNYTAFDTFSETMDPKRVLFADFISSLPEYLATLETNPHDLHNLQDVRQFTQSSPLEEYPHRDTAVWDFALRAGINNTSPEFWPLYQQNIFFGGEGGVLGALKRHNLDAIILPTEFSYAIPALVGSPIVNVPMGAWPDDTPVQYGPVGELVTRAPGLPIGLSFMGDLWSEESLIGMAYAYEQANQQRDTLKRYIQPTTELRDVQ